MNDYSDLKELSNELEKSLLNENLELIADSFDSSLELITALECIPTLGNLVKVFRGYSSLSDHFFKGKILRFLFHLKDTTGEERQQFIKKIKLDKKRRGKVGEEILNILNKIDDSRKEDWVAHLFVCSIQEKISIEELFRYLNAVNRSYFEDISKAIEAERDQALCSSDTYENLFHVGLAKITGVDGGKFEQEDLEPMLNYELNIHGKNLVTLLIKMDEKQHKHLV